MDGEPGLGARSAELQGDLNNKNSTCVWALFVLYMMWVNGVLF